MNDTRLYRKIAIGIVMFWLLFMIAIPNALVLAASFMTIDGKTFVAMPFNIDNYLNLFDPVLFKLILNSIKVALGTTFFCLLVGYPFAYAIATASKKYRSLLLMLIIVPFWTNSLIRNYALITILSANGIINRLLLAIGLIDAPLQILYTNTAVFIGMSYTLLPFSILPLYSSLEKLDYRLLEAGRDLGAGTWQIVTKILVPQTMPGIIAAVILVFLPALSMFYVSDLLGGADAMVVGNIIRNKFLIARDWPMGAAVSVFLTAVMIILYICYRRSAAIIAASRDNKDKGGFLL